MEYNHCGGGEELMTFNKLLSRKHSSLIGCSSRTLYYPQSPEGVPFKWEMQPGTPKDQPQEDILPPLSPPPAVLSLGFPKPCINIDDIVDEPKTVSIKSRLLMLLKHHNNNNNKKKKNKVQKVSKFHHEDNGKFEINSLELYSSDGDEYSNMGSPSNSSSSSSSSSLSSSRSSSWLSRLQSPARDISMDRRDIIFHGCGPWNFASVVRVGKKV